MNSLVEGISMRGASRLVDCSINTVAKTLAIAGSTAACVHNEKVVWLHCKHVQCDELTAFVQQKRNKVYTWLAIDADSKLLISYHTGGRTRADAEKFCEDLEGRIVGKCRIYTDAFAAYKSQIAEVFGSLVRHTIIKKQGDAPKKILGKSALGQSAHTSFVERMNMTIRMGNKRFARRGNAFSKNMAYHKWMIDLQIANYNFCRIHKTLRVTPAMQHGITDRVWDISDFLRWSPENSPDRSSEVFTLTKTGINHSQITELAEAA